MNRLYSPSVFLYIGEAFSTLTYVIGTLIYGLPIPVYGLKKWGPRLIQDGIYTMILVSLWGLYYYISELILGFLGASWPDFFSWSANVVSNELSIIFVIQSISALLKTGSYGLLGPLLSPLTTVISIITYSLSILESAVSIGYIVYNLFGILAALGAMLMAFPFRIGRVAGASVLAFSIVFYAGLPYMPIFFSNIFGYNNINQALLSDNQQIQYSQTVQVVITQLLPQVVSVSIIGPIMYLSLLATISVGLASLLSGSYGRMPIPLDLV